MNNRVLIDVETLKPEDKEVVLGLDSKHSFAIVYYDKKSDDWRCFPSCKLYVEETLSKIIKWTYLPETETPDNIPMFDWITSEGVETLVEIIIKLFQKLGYVQEESKEQSTRESLIEWLYTEVPADLKNDLFI